MERAVGDGPGGEREGDRSFQYDAFISYSRAADTTLASALHTGLHRFARPWYRLRALRVFRDDASLAANPALWGSIEKALSSSRFLILLACAASAQSEWVTREVEYWCRHRDVDHLLVVLTDPPGEPPQHRPRLSWDPSMNDMDWRRTTALSANLRGLFRDRPRFVDMGWARARAELSLRDPAFQEALADLAAPLWGRPEDELIGADVREHRRTLRWVRAAVGALTTFALIASVAVVLAVGARNTALDRTAVAEARQYAAESRNTVDPYAAVSLAVAAEERVTPPLPEARSAFAAASQRIGTWTSRLVAKFSGRPAVDLAWSADGAELVAANLDDSSVDRWNVWSGRAELGLPAVPGFVNTGVAADRRTVVSHSDTQFLTRDVRASGGRPSGPFGAGPLQPDDLVSAAALSSDRTMMATVTRYDVLRRWDARNGRPVAAPEQIYEVSELAWSPKHRLLATASGDEVVVRDLTRGTTVRAVTAGHPYRLAWSPSGDRLAVGGLGWIQLVDSGTGTTALPLVDNSNEMFHDLAWSADGRRLASAGTDVRVWDVASQRQIGAALAMPEAVLAWSADSEFLALNSGNRFEVWEFAPLRPASEALGGFGDAVESVAWSPDGTQVAGASADGSVRVWDARTRRSVTSLPLQAVDGNPIHTVAWSPDGRHLASASADGVRVRDWPPKGTEPVPPIWASGGTLTLAWSPDSARLVSGYAGGAIRVWDIATRKRVGHPAQHDPAGQHGQLVKWVTWPGDGRALYSVSDDGTVRRWHAHTRTPATVAVRIAPAPLQTMSFSPDGALTAVGGDGAIRILRTDNGRPVRTIDGNENGVTALAWSPDGSRLASSGPDNSIRIWDTGSGALLGETIGTRSVVRSLAWSPDGTRVASGGGDHTVRLWTSLTEQSACRIALSKLALTKLTRSGAGIEFDICSHPESVRDQPPVPILPMPG